MVGRLGFPQLGYEGHFSRVVGFVQVTCGVYPHPPLHPARSSEVYAPVRGDALSTPGSHIAQLLLS